MSETTSLPDCEEVVSGQSKSVDVGGVEDSVEIATSHSTITVTPDDGEFALVVTGKHTTIRVPGKEETVRFYNAGQHNKVIFASELDVQTEMDSGSHTTVERQRSLVEDLGNEDEPEVDVEEVIDQTRSEAIGEAGLFGTYSIEYQTPAAEKHEDGEEPDWCEGCGSDADAIIYSHSEDVFLLFGFPVSTKNHSEWMECENCAFHYTPEDVELDEDERKDIYG